MQPQPSAQKQSEQADIARAMSRFLSSGGTIGVFDSLRRPVQHLSWKDQSDLHKALGLTLEELNPPKAKVRAVPMRKPCMKRAHEEKSIRAKAERDAHADKVRSLAATGMSRNKIAKTIDMAPMTVARIAKEHDITLTEYQRLGTKQARNNATLREEWT